jgi:RimJ/RimL family protein N-acetyltransferase
MITIGFLADYPDTVSTLVKWFRNQWPDYFADKSNAQMVQDFLSETRRDGLPSRLVAFESNQLAGTIVLREYGTETPPAYQPELGGLFVLKHYRDRGIGTELVRSGMKLALNQGYERVYATTIAAANILLRLGWEFIKTVDHQDGQLELYQCKL